MKKSIMSISDRDDPAVERVFQDFFDQANPMYFNVNEVPEEWRVETQALAASHEIHGDGNLLIGIRKKDLRNIIMEKRSAEGK